MNFEYMSISEVADFLGITAQTLSVWRMHKTSDLSYFKIGRKILYSKADVESFLESCRCKGIKKEDTNVKS